MDNEVRYQMLRPAQVVKRRKDFPVAYVPLGNLEWHGVHNPLGADTLQAEGLAVLCARKGGGLVLPPLYYGENRAEALMEASSPDREQIAEAMSLPSDSFAAARQPFGVMEQTLNYNKLLLHILAEAQCMGFELAVLVAGHYPLLDHARSAVLMWNQRRYSSGPGMLAWAFSDYALLKGVYEYCGDHAGLWETSHCMHLHPQTVDLDALPPKGSKLIGVGGKPPHDSTAEFGRETLERAAELALKEVQHRLAHKDLYYRNGMSLQEGLWKNAQADAAD